MVFSKIITAKQRAYALYLRRECNASFQVIAGKCGISKSSARRICGHQLLYAKKEFQPRKGRPRKVSERDKRILLRTLNRMRTTNVNFTVKQLVKESGFTFQLACERTFSRCLNENGYYFLQARKKGMLNEKDKTQRFKYAKQMKRQLSNNPNFWKEEIAFYLDGVSFIYKRNPLNNSASPKARVWRKQGEGLQITAKGSKDLAGGRRLHLLVAIAHGKGVILKEPYEKMNGRFFSQFIRDHFNLCFAAAGPKRNEQRLFVMDNDPSQNSRPACQAMEEAEATLHKIPPRSPDLNPIENIFHVLRHLLDDEAESCNITHETFDQFKGRVLRTLESIDIKLIDKTIESMSKRIDAVLASKGGRSKY